jgi:hypothetical protein
MDKTGTRRVPGMLGWGATPGVRDLDGLSLRTMHYHALVNFGLLTRAAIAEMSGRDLLRIPRLSAIDRQRMRPLDPARSL